MLNSLPKQQSSDLMPEEEILSALNHRFPNLGEAAWVVAIPHWFDEEVLTELLPGISSPAKIKDLYSRLRKLPFIASHEGDRSYRVHDLTRRNILKLWWLNRQERYLELSERVASYFAAHDDDNYRIEAAYHSLVTPAEDPHQAANQWNDLAYDLYSVGQFSLLHTLLLNTLEHIEDGRLPNKDIAQLVQEWRTTLDQDLSVDVRRSMFLASIGWNQMLLQPLKLDEVLSRLQFETDKDSYVLLQQSRILMNQGQASVALERAQSVLREGILRHDRDDQAIASAYVAAAYASQGDYSKALPHADDAYRIFLRKGNRHNTAVMNLLLATIYQMHLNSLNAELIESLHESQERSRDLHDKALSKGDVPLAAQYGQQLSELEGQVRRARWIRALPYTLPAVWLPALDPKPNSPPAQSSTFEGYMEPVLFTLRSKQQAADDESGKSEPGAIDDNLYTARPLPDMNNPDATPLHPPRLDPNTRYVAIKIDPDSARLPGFDPNDYLLVRLDDPTQWIQQVEAAGGDFTGWKFERTADGTFQFTVVPPKFIGVHQVPMLVLKVDAILRRVP